jgi:hypothetical protein
MSRLKNSMEYSYSELLTNVQSQGGSSLYQEFKTQHTFPTKIQHADWIFNYLHFLCNKDRDMRNDSKYWWWSTPVQKNP